jgi:GT2 family glycosyltransferase
MDPVSIILKVWNASRHVKLCLETLLAHTDSPFELIIVDNGSRHKLKDYLRRKVQAYPNLRLIENSKNLGPGCANRQGGEMASNNLICLMDSDVMVPPRWLSRLVEEFEQNPAIKLLAPLQHEETVRYPFGKEERDTRQVWFETKREHDYLMPVQQYLMYSNGLNIELFEEAVLKANPLGIRVLESPPDFLSSCCAILYKSFAEEVGGVADPDFRGYGSEDVDLCWRIGYAGGVVAKTSSVYVHHFQGASLEDNDVDRQSALRLANGILYEKWKDKLLELVAHKAQAHNVELVEYLESHFIYSALANHTSFIHDLRDRLNNPQIPEDIVWRPVLAA